MFLSIDAGNSNIVFSFYDASSKSWTKEFRVETRRDISELELEQKVGLFLMENDIRSQAISKVGISSVVPEINKTLEKFSSKFLGLDSYLLSGRSYAKLPVSTTRPDEIGSDLMCNVMAAYQRFANTCIIVDFGTALTFTVVDNRGMVLGVSIAPGIKTAIRSLSSSTSKLPEIELSVPDSAIGKNTIHAIQAGIIYGYVGLVNGMLDAIVEELGYSPPVIATGGLSNFLPKLESRFDHIDRHLTVEGIRLITEINLAVQP
jgi:type III pantothenate kinase